MEKKNISKNYICEVHNKTLRYTGVIWNKRTKKWQVQLNHDKKKYNGGYFNNKEDASMRVNQLCDNIGIQLEEHEIRAIKNVNNKIILFDLQQVKQMFKKQPPNEQKKSM